MIRVAYGCSLPRGNDHVPFVPFSASWCLVVTDVVIACACASACLLGAVLCELRKKGGMDEIDWRCVGAD